MENLVITGFSGTGKSAVAGEVARRLGWDVVDTDEEVAGRAGKPIAEIFRDDGEARFREMEREEVARACLRSRTVIAVGGGAIVDRQNYDMLARSGLIVCLEARPATIYRRLYNEAARSPQTEVRPLLDADDPLERIRQLKASRQPFYAASDWTVHTDYLDIGRVADEVVRAWRLLQGAQVQVGPTASGGSRSSLQAQSGDGVACLVETVTGRYPVFVGYGLLDDLGNRMHRASLSGAVIIISDNNVFALYGQRVEDILKGAGFGVHSFVVPAGEDVKSLDHAARIYDFLVRQRVERDDIIIALGGGVVGDLAGFVAATFMRGISWVQVPTSLIAMVDASIGGKVGVNHAEGKNLIGAFYQPSMVLADCQTLATLPERELVSGWAEVIKHGLILDEEFFLFLESNAERLKSLEPEVLTKAIARSAAIKAGVVSQDEREREGKRTILNFGHTIGHGLEAATGYQSFLHGEAVAIGMMGAAMLSRRLGLLSLVAVERQQALLDGFGLPTSLSATTLTSPGSASPSSLEAPSSMSLRAKRSNLKVSIEGITRAMELDKKRKGKTIRWVLLENIGRAVIRTDVPQEEVLAVLHELAQS
jgi:shikimate kinase / 3-dehydroquinate synthase